MLAIVLLLACVHSSWNEFEYAQKRINEMHTTRLSSFSGHVSLTEDEEIVDRFAEHLKAQDTANWTLMRGDIHPGSPHGEAPPYARYFDKTTRSMIEKSAFYNNMVRTLPKGANLHVHDGARANRISLLKTYLNDAGLYVKNSADESKGHLSWFVGGTHPPSSEWIPAKSWTAAEHEQYIMVDNMQFASDNKKYEAYPWHSFGHAYTRWDNFAWYEKVYHTWVNESIYEAIRDNIQYLEIRAAFGKIYGANSSYSKSDDSFQPLDPSGHLELGIWSKLIAAAPSDHFFDMRAIYQVGRTVEPGHMGAAVSKAIGLQSFSKGLIVGFDVVGGEDNGKPDLEFLRELGLGSDKIQLFLHAGETSWAEDSLDPSGVVAPLENLYEAVLLGAKRIGHALGLAKNPVLLNMVKKAGICVELCPISNNILGFIRDLRQHPGISYLRQGVQGVIASDDAGLFGTTLSMDFYQVWHAWGLRLYDIHQLILNSWSCSGVSDKEKADHSKRWKVKWDSWVQHMKAQGCDEYNKKLKDKFHLDHAYTAILPSHAPLNKTVDVLIFNRNISTIICPRKILCRFGELSSGEASARYLGPNELLCTAHASKFAASELVYVSIDEKNWVSTGQLLHFVG